MAIHVRRIYQAKAKGGKLYSFINSLFKNGIYCRNQSCKGDTYQFQFYAGKRKEVESLAEFYHVTLQLQPYMTLRELLHRYRFRFGIPIGVLLSFGILFYCSNIVMEIDIVGNKNASSAKISAVLEECGVKRGSWIPSISFATCEHKLRAAVEELAWVGIRHTGNRLVVEVMEATPKLEMQETQHPSNIVSAYDGQIVSVSIYRGQLMRLVGDAVQKGELLVSGIVTDETGHLGIRHAMGSIIGQYQQTETFSCEYVQEIRSQTGRESTATYFDLFTFHIPLGKSEDPYQDSVLTTSQQFFSFLGKDLPIGIYRKTYHEYRTKTIFLTEEEAQINLKEQVDRYEENFLQDVTILDKKNTVLKSENGVEWTITYTLQGEIGVQREVFIND